MGFIKNITAVFKAAPKQVGTPLPMSSNVTGYSGIYNFLNGRRNRNFLEEYSGWVFACVDTISDSVSSVEFLLKKGKGKDDEVIESSPILGVLDQANPYMTKYDLLKATQAYLDLEGNAFWYIVKDSRGIPQGIWPLRPDLVQVVPSKTEFIAGYVYKIGSEKFTIPASEIIHFKNFNPLDPYRGLGVVQAAVSSVDADNYSKEYNAAFFANSARPDVILESPDSLTDDERNRILSSWKDTHGGPNKSNGVGLIWGGLKATLFGTSAKDMDFVEQRKFSRDEILAMFRMPKNMLGIVEDMTYASAMTTNYVYVTRCVKPKMQRIVNTLNEFFVPMFGDDSLVLTFVDPSPTNRTETLAEYTAALSSGWMTTNEVRVLEGREPIKGGDTIYVDFGKNPVGELKKEVKEVKQQSLIDTKSVASELVSAITELKEQTEKNEEFEKKGIARKDAVEDRAKDFEKDFESLMAEFFVDQSKRVAKAMKNSEKSIKGFEDYFNIKDEKAALIAYMSDMFKEIFSTEGQAALDENDIQFVFDEDSARIKKVIEKNTAKFAGGVTDTTADAVREAVRVGLVDGQSLNQIASGISDISGFSKERATLIARTEVITTQNMASVEAWKESGVVTKKIWYTAQDERVCPFCSALHGEVVGISKNFVDRGSSVDGGGESYDVTYRNIGEPALHPGCRCVVLPVVEYEKAVRLAEVKESVEGIVDLYKEAKEALKSYEQED